MGIHVIPCKYMYLKFPLCLKGLQGVQRWGQRDSWVRGTIFLGSGYSYGPVRIACIG